MIKAFEFLKDLKDDNIETFIIVAKNEKSAKNKLIKYLTGFDAEFENIENYSFEDYVDDNYIVEDTEIIR